MVQQRWVCITPLVLNEPKEIFCVEFQRTRFEVQSSYLSRLLFLRVMAFPPSQLLTKIPIEIFQFEQIPKSLESPDNGPASFVSTSGYYVQPGWAVYPKSIQ